MRQRRTRTGSSNRAAAVSVLAEADGVPLTGKTITFFVEQKSKKTYIWVTVATSVTGQEGIATVTIPAKYISSEPKNIKAVFVGDDSFLPSESYAKLYRIESE